MGSTFIDSMLTVQEVYMLDIDNEMVIIENILRELTPHNVDYNVWYMRGRRLPIVSKVLLDKYRNTGMMYNVPLHPYLVIPLLKDMIEYYQYHHTSLPELFRSNEMINTTAKYNVTKDDDDVDIILQYADKADDHRLYDVANIFLNVYNKCLKKIYGEYPDNVYSICTITNIYRLIRYDDIRIYRYNELISRGDEYERIK